VIDGLTVNYGFRTLVKLTVIPYWWDFSGSRTIMALRARVASLDEQFVFAQLDGKGQTIARYEAAIKGICKELYDLGALYGNTPADAYSVDTGPAVNTTAQLQAGNLSAQIRVKVSPFAEHVITNISRRPLTAAL
jgi:phage tail sheath protein FI